MDALRFENALNPGKLKIVYFLDLASADTIAEEKISSQPRLQRTRQAQVKLTIHVTLKLSTLKKTNILEAL